MTIIQSVELKILTEFDFHQTLDRTAGPVLVLFSSTTCGACRAVERSLPHAANGIVADLFIVDVQHSTGLARAYEIFHLPTLFLFVDGLFHAQINCAITADKLQQAIETALALPAEEEP